MTFRFHSYSILSLFFISIFDRNEAGLSNQAMVVSPNPMEGMKENNVFIHSHIQSVSGIGDNVVIEYTSLNTANNIGSGSIISNNIFPKGVTVPGNSFLHTVVIRDEGEPMYVTIAFGTDDNLKKCCQSRAEVGTLKYAGLKFDDALEKFNMFHVSGCVGLLPLYFYFIFLLF